jgi:hypothetical protein
MDSPVVELDFRRATWGHKLHSATFREEDRPPIVLADYPWWNWNKKRDEARLNAEADKQDASEKARRYSFMVHSMYYPRVGMVVIWKGSNGDVRGTLYDCKREKNVDDMYTLKVKVTG